MYTDEDLTQAVDKGIFSQDSVQQFRKYVSDSRHTPAVDEENFRLLTGFQRCFCSHSQWFVIGIHRLVGR